MGEITSNKINCYSYSDAVNKAIEELTKELSPGQKPNQLVTKIVIRAARIALSDEIIRSQLKIEKA